MAQPYGSAVPRSGTIRDHAGQGGLVRRVGGAGLGGLAVLGALALWFHYGTAVFFEMIAAGIAACF